MTTVVTDKPWSQGSAHPILLSICSGVKTKTLIGGDECYFQRGLTNISTNGWWEGMSLPPIWPHKHFNKQLLGEGKERNSATSKPARDKNLTAILTVDILIRFSTVNHNFTVTPDHHNFFLRFFFFLFFFRSPQLHNRYIFVALECPNDQCKWAFTESRPKMR